MRLALVLCAACTARQAHTAHRAGEIAAAGGLVGIIGTVGVSYAFPDDQAGILKVGIAFVPVTVIGALLYIATDSMVNKQAAPDVREDRTRDTAMDLAKQAKHAARRGDCAEVLAIEPRVRDLDAGIYRRFRHDEVIRTCLPADGAVPPEADGAVPPEADGALPPEADGAVPPEASATVAPPVAAPTLTPDAGAPPAAAP